MGSREGKESGITPKFDCVKSFMNANRDTISPIGIVRDVEVLCGKVKDPADFLVLGSPQDSFSPIIFGRPFLNTVNARIDCEKDVVTIGLGDMSHDFNFAKFCGQPHDR